MPTRPTKSNTMAKKAEQTSRPKRADEDEATARKTKGLSEDIASGQPPLRHKLHLISDFTGNLANHIVTSVLSQFPNPNVEKMLHMFTNRDAKLIKAMKLIRSPSDLVLHAVVSPEHKRMIAQHCEKLGIGCLDLTGPISNFLSEHLQLTPRNDPDELHKVDSSYFQRIDAMEFTLQHDDSRRLETIDQADIVLVGISRVSKSPTSTFLGSLGFRTANVSIAPALGLPLELKRCRGRVVALTMRPRLLYEIRKRRFELNKFAPKLAEREELSLDYLKPRDVAREVMDAESLYRKARIPIVDVSEQTIEESAGHVLEALRLVPRA